MNPFNTGSGLPPENSVFWDTSSSSAEPPFTIHSFGSSEHRSQEPPPIRLSHPFSSSTGLTQALEQRIIQLENENSQLRSHIHVLNAQYNTLSEAYDGLLDRLPDARTALDPLDQADHPDVKFWFKRDWLDSKGDDLDGVIPPQEPLRGRSRSSQGINVAMRYIEGRDGVVVSGDRASAIKDFARAVWDKLKKRGPMPTSWRVADSDTRKIYYYEMAQRFYELRLCELDWKSDQIAKEGYSYWRGTKSTDPDDTTAVSNSKRSRTVSIKAIPDSESKRLKANALDVTVHDNASGLPFVTPGSTGAMVPEPCLPFMALQDSELDFSIPNFVNLGPLTDFPSLPMAPAPIMSGAGSSTSTFHAYSESTGVAGVQSIPLTVIPSMVAPPPAVKKPVKMRSTGSSTGRNLCSRDWCPKNPHGTTVEFAQYYNSLPQHEKERYRLLGAADAERKLAEKRMAEEKQRMADEERVAPK